MSIINRSQPMFKQDLFEDMGNLFGEVTGFGGNGNPNPHNTSPEEYAHLYREALAGVEAVGADEKSKKFRSGIDDSAIAMLGDLENNAAGRKANFQEDMARGFQADMTSRGRAAGGSGNLASTLNPSGDYYDAQARAQSRGLIDLESAAINDLAGLGSIQNQGYNQDMGKAMNVAGIKTGELGQRRGLLQANNENTFNSEQVGREKRANTLNGIAQSGQSFGKMMSMGGG